MVRTRLSNKYGSRGDHGAGAVRQGGGRLADETGQLLPSQRPRPPGEAGDAGQARRPGQLGRSQGRGEGPLAPTPGSRKGF